MPEYRRAKVPGGTFFITVVTFNRLPIFLNPIARDLLHVAWEDVTRRFPFTTDAICLLPDHIHALITLPEEDADFSMRIREIKRLFTRVYLAEIGSVTNRSRSRMDKNEATVWQRRFYEHTIRDERDLNTHMDYIHFNPVKHGLVSHVSEWQWSSFHRYVKNGYYSPDWGDGVSFKDEQDKFGE
jgi:putative transposase